MPRGAISGKVMVLCVLCWWLGRAIRAVTDHTMYLRASLFYQFKYEYRYGAL